MNHDQIDAILENIDEHVQTPEGRHRFTEALMEVKANSMRLYGLPLYVVYYDEWGPNEAEEWYASSDDFAWESQIETIAAFRVREADRKMFEDLDRGDEKVYLGYADNGALYELSKDVAEDMIGEYKRFYDKEEE